MKISQISLFLENRKGRLYEVCSLLGANAINIRALNIAETDEFGVLRIVVDKPDAAIALFKANHFVASVSDIVAVEIHDKPGGLAEVLRIVTEKGLNIEYMYGFIEKKSDKALMVFRFDRPDEAIPILLKNKVTVVGANDIENL
jgi:hypothetical protein